MYMYMYMYMYIIVHIDLHTCTTVCYSNGKPTDCTVVEWQFSGAVLVRIFSICALYTGQAVNCGQSESMVP